MCLVFYSLTTSQISFAQLTLQLRPCMHGRRVKSDEKIGSLSSSFSGTPGVHLFYKEQALGQRTMKKDGQTKS